MFLWGYGLISERLSERMRSDCVLCGPSEVRDRITAHRLSSLLPPATETGWGNRKRQDHSVASRERSPVVPPALAHCRRSLSEWSTKDGELKRSPKLQKVCRIGCIRWDRGPKSCDLYHRCVHIEYHPFGAVLEWHSYCIHIASYSTRSQPYKCTAEYCTIPWSLVVAIFCFTREGVVSSADCFVFGYSYFVTEDNRMNPLTGPDPA